MRRKGLGGSDIAAILGEHEGGRTPLDVYLSKVTEREEPETPPMRRGRALEPVAMDLYEELTGHLVRRGLPMEIDGEHDCLIANVDAAVVGQGPTGTELGVLEVKVPGLKAFAKMKTAGIPKQYVLQVQHYLGVTGLPFGVVAALNAERWELLHFPVLRDDELIRVIRMRAVAWWEEHVVCRVPPTEEPQPLPKELLTEPGEVTTFDSPMFRQAVAEHREAQALMDGAEDLFEQTKARIVELMGSATVAECDGLRVYNRFTKGRRSFKTALLEAVAPVDSAKLRAALLENGGNPAFVDALIDRCKLDLDPLYQTGNPYRTFRTFEVKRGGSDD